jgi:hypothetical protein
MLTHEKRMTHREVFFAANGFGPWLCQECGEVIEYMELEIHHVNGDHGDNRPLNLSAMHERCHSRITHLGRKHSMMMRVRLSRSLMGLLKTPEHRAKISAGLLGNKNTLGKPWSLKRRAAWQASREV